MWGSRSSHLTARKNKTENIMITLDNFEGHLILYCKGHYAVNKVDFLTGLRRIWAVRCGFDVEHIDKSIDEYIANALYRIVKKVKPNKVEYLFELIHKEVSKTYLSTYEGLSTIEILIMIYRSELSEAQVRESKAKLSGKPMSGYTTLIKLPKPQKRLFKRIVSGKGEYNDYKLVK